MVARRALISTDALRGMAKVVSEYGVTFRGRVDALGGLTFTMLPNSDQTIGERDDDFDDRLAEFGGR